MSSSSDGFGLRAFVSVAGSSRAPLLAFVPVVVGGGLAVLVILVLTPGPWVLANGLPVPAGTTRPTWWSLLLVGLGVFAGTVVGARAAADEVAPLVSTRPTTPVQMSAWRRWGSAVVRSTSDRRWHHNLKHAPSSRGNLAVLGLVIGVLVAWAYVSVALPVALRSAGYLFLGVTTAWLGALLLAWLRVGWMVVRASVPDDLALGRGPQRRFFAILAGSIGVLAVLAGVVVSVNPFHVPTGTVTAGPTTGPYTYWDGADQAFLVEDGLVVIEDDRYTTHVAVCSRSRCREPSYLSPRFAPRAAVALGDDRVGAGWWSGETTFDFVVGGLAVEEITARADSEDRGSTLDWDGGSAVLTSVPGELVFPDGYQHIPNFTPRVAAARLPGGTGDGLAFAAAWWVETYRPIEEWEIPTEFAVEVYRCADLTCAEPVVDRTPWADLDVMRDTTVDLAVGPDGTSYTLVKAYSGEGNDIETVLLVGDGSGALVPRVLVSEGPWEETTLWDHDYLDLTAHLGGRRTSVVVGQDGLARVLLGRAGDRPNLLISCHDVGCTSWGQQPVGLSYFLDMAVDSTGRPLLLGSSKEGAVLISCLDVACTSRESAVVDVHGEEWNQMQVVVDERDRPVLALQDHVMWCDAPRCGLP